MENFELGHHVMVELLEVGMPCRKIAGYLMSVEDDGLILKVTHKESGMTRMLSDASRISIEKDLAEMPIARLRLAALLRGRVGVAFGSRAVLETVLFGDIEEDILVAKDDGIRMREMSEPVLTFVSYGIVGMMEATDDKLLNAELTNFESGLDGMIREILDNTSLTEPQAAAGDVEAEGP